MKDTIQKNDESDEYSFNKSVFHLKTLCDVSHALLEQESIENTLRNFLLMTMGSFGVVEGFAFIHEEKALLPENVIAVGIDDVSSTKIEKGCHKLLTAYDYVPTIEQIEDRKQLEDFPDCITYLSIFNIAYSCNGILGLGPKIVGDPYGYEDLELLETLSINLATSLKNVRSTEALKSAFEEVSSVNQSKTKVINHLSHELKTPISLLATAMSLLRRHLSGLPQVKWKKAYARADRSLKRLSKIQHSVEDIMQDKIVDHHRVVTILMNECADVLESLAEEQMGDYNAIDKIKKRIDDLYQPEDLMVEPIDLVNTVGEILKEVQIQAWHRNIEYNLVNELSPTINIPKRILDTIVMGLIKNAIENTPDEGRIEINISGTRQGVNLSIQDYGTGIAAKDHEFIFTGFYPTQATDKYSTRKPFDFNAGGKGTDLMRIKIFSERYDFKIDMISTRCKYIPTSKDTCPGKISECNACQKPEDCFESGMTNFNITFTTMK